MAAETEGDNKENDNALNGDDNTSSVAVDAAATVSSPTSHDNGNTNGTANATERLSADTFTAASTKTTPSKIRRQNPLHNPVTANAQWAAVRANRVAAKGIKN